MKTFNDEIERWNNWINEIDMITNYIYIARDSTLILTSIGVLVSVLCVYKSK